MARKYNSADFRQMAIVKKTWHDDITAEMLFEAADLLDKMERKKKRKEKYEYAIKLKPRHGIPQIDDSHFESYDVAKDMAFVWSYPCCIVRRKVGEWKEVGE